jgi:hypothetical protein
MSKQKHCGVAKWILPLIPICHVYDMGRNYASGFWPVLEEQIANAQIFRFCRGA